MTDQQYVDQIIASLRSASYLISGQALEPTMGSSVEIQLLRSHRSTGPRRAADHESLDASLVDRPAEGAYVCWICGEKRANWRLLRAVEHARSHF